MVSFGRWTTKRRPSLMRNIQNTSSASAIEASDDIHTAIILFYKYFLPSKYPLLHAHPRYYENLLMCLQRALCARLQLRGRILLSAEGINGTLSASSTTVLQEYIDEMENFELVRDCGIPDSSSGSTLREDRTFPEERLFLEIDWKLSYVNNTAPHTTAEKGDGVLEPFPDLKVAIVDEIINSGGAASVDDVEKFGGRHLSPAEFHQELLDHPDAVVIDVRNTYEYNIGRFVHPITRQHAVNPEMVTFSSFDGSFCAPNVNDLKDRKVLMYCTGGIRCEKASAMLKKRGVADVSQLKGGIHRYLEQYGDNGWFRGLNFVFDQRITMKPSECVIQGPLDTIRDPLDPSTLKSAAENNLILSDKEIVVGKCVNCDAPFDELCGSRICTVCRDLVLVCPACQELLWEYHCDRHAAWKDCYFTFLDIFDQEELVHQHDTIQVLREPMLPATKFKNIRRTLQKQIDKLQARIVDLQTGKAVVDRQAPRRCRTCMEPRTVCDGCCWGFWKRQRGASGNQATVETNFSTALKPIACGDFVEPGPTWNEFRLGPRMGRRGIVVEVKPWGTGNSAELNCVAVCWNIDSCVPAVTDASTDFKHSQPQIYRWGVLALNGERMYDVQRCNKEKG